MMKTHTYLSKLFVSIMFALPLIGCGNSGSNNNPTTYYMSNGNCYGNNGQIVSQNYCSGQYGQYNTGYVYSNGQCIQQSTGQPVNPTYCQNNGGYNGGYGQQCNGTYYQYTYYGWQQIYCQGANCRGQTLYNQTGQTVVCQ